jgi:hypothetical protein
MGYLPKLIQQATGGAQADPNIPLPLMQKKVLAHPEL